MKITIIFLSVIIFSNCNTSRRPFSLFYNFVKPQFHKIVDASINGTQCSADLKRLLRDLLKPKLWALKMIDANSKLNPGILHGNMRFFGSYDECLSVKNTVNNRRVINGQYCTAPLVLHRNKTKQLFDTFKTFIGTNSGKFIDWKIFIQHFKILVGFCVPKSCTAKNLNALSTQLTQLLRIPAEATFFDDTCFYEKKQVKSNPVDIYVFYYFGIIFGILLACTLYDIYLKSFQKIDIIISFSLITNMKKLFTTRCENDILTCIYGIKVLSMIWIILGHIAVSKSFAMGTNSVYVMEWKNHLENTIFFAAPYAVETFFSISGLLVVYIHLKYHKKTKIDICLFYFHRLVRLIPALLTVILFYVTAVKYLVEGPLSLIALKTLTYNCEHFWWGPLFFINNFVDFGNQCIQQTWYLSIDTQLYAFFPCLLFFLEKYPKKTFVALGTIYFFSVAYTSYKIIKYNLGFIIYSEISPKDASFVYFSTISRLPSWLNGVISGYLLYKFSLKKIQFPKKINLMLWSVSLFLMISLILYHTVLLREEFSVTRSVFFNSFSRFLWSASVCFIILSCCTGCGGFVNKFLSHPVFIILGKLTYCMFLVHAAIIYIVISNKRHSSYFSNFDIYFDFCGIFVLTLICSTVLWLGFEAPIFTLLKNFEKRKSKKNS